MFHYERVVHQVWVGCRDPIEFGGLPWGERLCRVEATGRWHKPLPSQHLENAGDATPETISRIEDRGIHVGHRNGFR